LLRGAFGNGCAGDGAAWTDQDLDFRRYVFSKARLQLSWRAPSVLRAAWQASQLPGGSDTVDRNHDLSLPIAFRLYLPKQWTEDAARRKKADVPKAIAFKTNRRSRLNRSARRARRAYRAVWC
jgi:DDE superfamily endonuclease